MPNTPVVAASFRILDGPLKGKKLRFETSIITLGRGEEAGIGLPGDRAVSRLHAEIELVDGHYVLRNKSDSGTFVNDKLVETKRLESGDRIRIGQLYLIEFIEESGDAKGRVRGGFLSPKLMAGGALYLAILAAMAIFLSKSHSADDGGLSGEKIQEVLQQYSSYTGKMNLPREEQDARRRTVEAYLRSGLIA